jgi:hypothetical protein
LTTTSRPLRSRAPWIWPIDADAIGASSSRAKCSRPTAASISARISPKGTGGTSSTRTESSSM